MSPNILGNVAERSGEFPNIFREMLASIPGNAAKNSGECSQASWAMPVSLKGMKTLVSSRFHGICSTEYCMECLARG